MRHARTVPRLPTTGRGLLLLPHELAALDMLPDWCFRLFAALVRLSDYRTGQGSTSYEHLAGLMTPDQPPSGPRWHVRTRDELKNMLTRLECVGLLTRHTRLSERGKAIFFDVLPRSGKPASDLESTRQTTRREHRENTDKHGKRRNLSTGTDPTTDPPIQERNSIQRAGAHDPVDNPARPIAEALEIGPPRGADTPAAAPPTPPGPALPPHDARARLRQAREHLAKRAGGSHKAPRGGQTPARPARTPPGAHLARPPDARSTPNPGLEEGSSAAGPSAPDALSTARIPQTGQGTPNAP